MTLRELANQPCFLHILSTQTTTKAITLKSVDQ